MTLLRLKKTLNNEALRREHIRFSENTAVATVLEKIEMGLDELARHSDIGGSVTRGGRKGADRVHGTKEERDAAHQKWQKYIDDLHRDNPTKKRHWLNVQAAEQFGVSYKTIGRHTQDPTK